MAKRPIFIPLNKFPYVEEKEFEFEWFPGFSKAQAQKSIRSLHRSAHKKGIEPVLEISSKSPSSMGVELSAFNLMMTFENGHSLSVECAFQGSKVFELGGPYQEIYEGTSIEAKKDERLRTSGDVIGFQLLDETFPTEPKTAFYDWLYIKALSQNSVYAKMLLKYNGFSDIAFNPQKSINCQARAAALFVSLGNKGVLEAVLEDRVAYLSTINGPQKDEQEKKSSVEQGKLPFNFENEENRYVM